MNIADKMELTLLNNKLERSLQKRLTEIKDLEETNKRLKNKLTHKAIEIEDLEENIRDIESKIQKQNRHTIEQYKKRRTLEKTVAKQQKRITGLLRHEHSLKSQNGQLRAANKKRHTELNLRYQMNVSLENALLLHQETIRQQSLHIAAMQFQHSTTTETLSHTLKECELQNDRYRKNKKNTRREQSIEK